MRRAFPLVLVLLLATFLVRAEAQITPGGGIQLRDEGTPLGRISILNFVGAGVTCAQGGGLGTCTITSGGGSGTVTSSGSPLIHQLSVFTTATDITGIPVGATGTLLQGATGANPAFTATPLATSLTLSANTNQLTLGTTNTTTVTMATLTGSRVFTLPNADSNPIQPATCSGSNFVNSISAAGVLGCATPAGSVTGSGTANFVPLWTGTTALGDSLLYEDPSSPWFNVMTVQGSGTVAADMATFLHSVDSKAFTVDQSLYITGKFAPLIKTLRFNGSYGTPTKSLANNAIFELTMAGWSGSAVVNGPTITGFTLTDSDVASPAYLLSIYGNSDLDTLRLGVSVTPELTITNGLVSIEAALALPAATNQLVLGTTNTTTVTMATLTGSRIFTLPNADSNPVQPATCTAGDFVSAVAATGVLTCATPAGSGTVTTTGSPASGNLTQFSGATSITNGNLTGDVTTTNTLATTLVNIPTGTTMAGSLLATAIAAPGTPAAGKGSIYVDSTSKNLAVKDDAGVVKHGVQTLTCTGSDFVNAISDAGAVTCATPAGSGTVTNSGTLTTDALILGAGTTVVTALGSLGTTTTVLHGNAAGAPSFGAVVSADLNITTSTCTNQFVTALSAGAVGTCTTATLASAQFANQGTTTTLLHGNAAGNPTFSGVAIADLTATGTPSGTTFLRGDNTWATPSGSGTVTGSGTTGVLTKWSDGAGGVLADSIVSESGAVMTAAGTVGAHGFSQNEELGTELVTAGDFSTGTCDDWTTTDWTCNAGTDVQHNTGNTTALFPSTPLSITVGTVYKLVYTITSRTAGSLRPTLGGASGAFHAANGTFTDYVIAVTTGNLLLTPLVSTFDGHIDNVSVKAITVPFGTGNGTPLIFSSAVGSGPLVAFSSAAGTVVQITDLGRIYLSGDSAQELAMLQKTTTGAGNSFTIRGSSPKDGVNAAGGGLFMAGSAGRGTGTGGSVAVTGGDPGESGSATAGNVSLNGGFGQSWDALQNAHGGNATLRGGIGGGQSGTGAFNGGSAFIYGEKGAASGTDGSVHIGLNQNASTKNSSIKFGLGGGDLALTTTWWFFDGNAAVGHLTPGTTNTYDLGSSSATARTGYFGTSVLVGGNTVIGNVAGKLNAAHLAIASQAVGDLLYADGTTTFTRLADVAVGPYLRAGGVGAAPLWSTLTLPNAATTGDILAATGTNAIGVIAATTSGLVLTANGAGVASTYQDSAASTLVFTNKTLNADSTGNVVTLPFKKWLPAAGCNNATAGTIWDLPTATPAVAACVTGTNTQKGVLQYADTSGGFSAQITEHLPADWTTLGGVDVQLLWTTSATSGNAKWTVQFICTATGATETDDTAFPTTGDGFNTVTTAVAGTANRVQSSIITGATLPTTGTGTCTTATSELLHIRVFRDGNDGADTCTCSTNLIGATITYRRAM
jgi:hypothetical protein